MNDYGLDFQIMDGDKKDKPAVKKSKGIKKRVVERDIKFDDYKVLSVQEEGDKETHRLDKNL